MADRPQATTVMWPPHGVRTPAAHPPVRPRWSLGCHDTSALPPRAATTTAIEHRRGLCCHIAPPSLLLLPNQLVHHLTSVSSSSSSSPLSHSHIGEATLLTPPLRETRRSSAMLTLVVAELSGALHSSSP
jgi:hypothetical protein